MSDKEILAELKVSYEYLQDIADNADNDQINIKQKRKILETINNIADIYEDVYSEKCTDMNIRIKKEVNENGNLVIADNVFCDYYNTETSEFVVKTEVNNYKWWEDYDFLNN